MACLRTLSTALKSNAAPIRTLATVADSSQASSSFLPTHVQAFMRDFKTTEPLSIVNLDRQVFGAPLRRDILHRVVVWQRDNMRQGTHSTKSRGDVIGTGKKAAPQKGRGKARVGDMKAPQFRGGGVAFGPKPRDHGTDLPRKVQAFGLRVALSTKYAQDELMVVETLQNLESFKTKHLATIMKQHEDDATMLMIVNDPSRHLELAARNLTRCEVIHVEETNVVDLLSYNKIIIEDSARQTLESVLKVE